MRILSVVLSFVVAMSLAGAGLSYLVNRIGEKRIQVQDSWISSGEEKGYRAYEEKGYRAYGVDTLATR